MACLNKGNDPFRFSISLAFPRPADLINSVHVLFITHTLSATSTLMGVGQFLPPTMDRMIGTQLGIDWDAAPVGPLKYPETSCADDCPTSLSCIARRADAVAASHSCRP